MVSQKILYLLRHAKAEAGSSSKDDHERRLIPRGVKASQAMGKYMAERGIKSEKILCSTAARARETLEISLRERDRGEEIFASGASRIEYTPRLYLASANETLQLIAQTPESVQSLLLVGHNPCFHQLAVMLAREGEKRLLDRLYMKFPAGSLATLTFNGMWKDISQVKGMLQDFVMPDSL